MKTATLRIFILFIFLGISTQYSFGTSYQWVGSTSTNWATSTNWSPSGVPDSADNVTISSGTYNLLLDQNRRVTNVTLSNKTVDLNSYSLTVYGTATMTSGTVTNGTFYARGTLAAFNGTLMDCPVDAICGYIRLSGSTFNETADFTDTGTATGTGTGGCTFNDNVTITHGGTLTYFTLANTTGDTFNGNVTFTNNSNRELYVATNGTTQFKGNIILNSTSTGGISFGNGTGSSTLDTGKTISIGTSGFAADFLTLKNFTQSGSAAQTLTLTGTAAVNMSSTTFNGNLTVSAPGFLLKNSTFNGTGSFTKTGTGNHQSDGGNVFNGAITLANNGTSGRIRMATVTADTYNSDATFNSTGQDVQIAYLGNNHFAGNITINSNKVVFNTSTGKVTFTGTNNQTLNGSYNYPFKKLAIDKTSGTVTANTTLSVDDSLIFIRGKLITTSTNLLTMKHGSTATGASNNSFVSGPVKKVGNTAFVFPVGKALSFQPIGISAPANSTNAYVGEHFEDSVLVNSNNRDAAIGYMNRAHYWRILRETGSSNVYITLFWDSIHPIIDTNVVVVSWNGSNWTNLGKKLIVGNKHNGSMESYLAASNFLEFTLGYNKILGPTAGCDCNDIQSASCLESCLYFQNSINTITADISLIPDQLTWSGTLPMPIGDGVTIRGPVISGITSAWWHPNCPLITTNHIGDFSMNPVASLYLFNVEPGGSIEGLRIRGVDCGVKDFNAPSLLSGGIFIISDPTNNQLTTISNCEISCFSQAAIWKADRTGQLNMNNNFIHKVRGKSSSGIGYGVWTQGDAVTPEHQTVNFTNCIFDDSKCAIDGQGDPITWNILDCTFSQFFSSEDINKHNYNEFTLGECPCSNPNNLPPAAHHFFDYTFSSNGTFYGGYWDPSTPCIQEDCAGGPQTTYPGHKSGPMPSNIASIYAGYGVTLSGLPFYDIGGDNTIIERCIFHKKWELGKNGNINLNYPNIDINEGGQSNNRIEIKDNVFSTELFDKDVVLNDHNNKSGYAIISDNYIEADFWNDDVTHIKKSGNTFNYKPGTTVGGLAPQPHELSYVLKNGSAVLNTSHTISPLNGQRFIPYVEAGTTINFEATLLQSGVSAEPFFVIRPNLNNGAPVNSQIISSNNFFYDNEIFAKATGSTSTEQITYDLPGLYGVDVLGFDGHDYGSGVFNFKGSLWNHIPIIVKGTEEQVIYFNIKDSYFGQATGIKMQAYLNDQLLWEEDISANDAGWQYVKIDLKENIPGTSKPFLSALKTGGERNSLSFGIWIDDHVYPIDIQGVSVWVDDIYMPRTANSAGDNLILDGTLELSNQKLCDNCYWFDNGKVTLSTGAPQLSINSIERRSGSSAMYLEIPYSETTSPFHSNNNGVVVASIGTYIDNTDLLTCYDYWTPDVSGLVPLGGYSNVDFEPFPGIVDATYDLKKFWVGSSWQIENGEKLTLNGCDLAMSPGTEIVVKDGGVLEINVSSSTTPPTPTYIFSCDAMWQGIIVEPGGEVNVIGNSSLMPAKIQNAIVAIQGEGNGASSGSPKIFVNLAEFDNNLTAIALEDDNYSSSMIQQSFFRCSSQMMNKAPHLGVYPEYHILLNEATSVVMGGGPSLNEFEDVFSGIRVNKSSLNIQKSLFKDLMDNSVSPSVKGIGIVASNTTATAQTIEVDSRFENLNRGLQVSGNFNVDVHDNFSTKYFRDIDDVAIFVNSMNYLRDISVVGINYFRNCNIGILLRGNNWNSVNISGNEFDNTNFNETRTGSFHNTAITVQKWGSIPANTGVVEIFDNNITDFRIGIHAINVSDINIGTDVVGTLLAGNTIEFKKSNFPLLDFHEGIWLQNCAGSKVANNSVFNSNANEDLNFRGLDIETSADCFLNCNTINKIGVGINIFDNCGTTKLRSNTMSNFFTGVWLNGPNGASIDVDQGDAASQESWGNIWNWLAPPSLKVDGGVLGLGQVNWYHEGADASSNSLSPRPWNGNIISPEPATGTASSLCTSFFRTTPNRQDNFGPVVGDSAIYSESEELSRYLASQNSYIAMKNDSTIIYRSDSLDTDFESFFLRMDSSNVGKFQKVRELSANWPDSANLINSSIADSNDIEYNLKTFNSLCFDKLLDGTAINLTDSTFLEALLSGSYLTDGESFYYAAAVQFREMHPTSYSARIGSNIHPITLEQTPIPTNSIKIFPNPANSNIKVEVSDADDKIILIELYASLGNLILSKSSNTTFYEMDIQPYKEGIYKIRIFTKSGYSGTKSFSIVR